MKLVSNKLDTIFHMSLSQLFSPMMQYVINGDISNRT